MLIDVHAHLGYDFTFDEDFKLISHLEKMRDCNVDLSILQPGTCHNLEDVKEEHNMIAAAAHKYPGKFYGMANPSPHLREQEYLDELKRCVEELKFIGVKLHPYAHGVNPSSKAANKVFEAAAVYDIPVMVHTGMGLPFADPINLIPIAQRFPTLKIIIAHCGAIILSGEALLAMKMCPNIYADTSWTPGFFIREGAHQLGADRFMLGADHADNCATEIAKIKTCGLNVEEREWIYGKTALKVFDINLPYD